MNFSRVRCSSISKCSHWWLWVLQLLWLLCGWVHTLVTVYGFASSAGRALFQPPTSAVDMRWRMVGPPWLSYIAALGSYTTKASGIGCVGFVVGVGVVVVVVVRFAVPVPCCCCGCGCCGSGCGCACLSMSHARPAWLCQLQRFGHIYQTPLNICCAWQVCV